MLQLWQTRRSVGDDQGQIDGDVGKQGRFINSDRWLCGRRKIADASRIWKFFAATGCRRRPTRRRSRAVRAACRSVWVRPVGRASVRPPPSRPPPAPRSPPPTPPPFRARCCLPSLTRETSRPPISTGRCR